MQCPSLTLSVWTGKYWPSPPVPGLKPIPHNQPISKVHSSGLQTSVRIKPLPSIQFSPVQSLSHVQFFATPWTAARLSITNCQSLLNLMSIKLVMPSNHLILCHPLLLPPSIFPSIRVFSNESVLHIRWPKYWSFTFSVSPSNEYSELISFRIDWLDHLAVQRTLRSSPMQHFKSINVIACVFHRRKQGLKQDSEVRYYWF